MSDRYFALRDHVGVTADDNLEPLVEIGMTANVAVMRDGEVVDSAQRYVIQPAEELPEGALARIVPGTRIVHTRDQRIAETLLQSESVEEIKPPTKQEIAKAKALTDAIEEAGTHAEPNQDGPGAPGEEV